MRSWDELIAEQWGAGRFSCVGLDIDLGRVPARFAELEPAEALVAFGNEIVDATADVVAAFKPNIAYFEQYGGAGLMALQQLIARCQEVYPSIPIIVDAKRADISNTNDGYVRSIFEELRADATTVHPYLGSEALRPFLDQRRKAIFVLCRTSNPGAGELQDLVVEGEPLYLRLARTVADEWTAEATLGLVVGATYPAELERVRRTAPETHLLVPGVGAQGGDLEATVRAGLTSDGEGLLINSSRAVLYASAGDDYAEAARSAVVQLNDGISAIRGHVTR